MRPNVFCVLCRRSEENETTGALSTKEEVTAHQNCLLFSSNICSQNSPEFDDLFGFSVDDVKKEVVRGRKLKCSRCKRNGATAGCEVRRCMKSYHYPCAVEDDAQILEDPVEGRYGLYCRGHHEKNSCISGDKPSTSQTSKSCSKASSSKINNGHSTGPSSSSFILNSSKRRLSSSSIDQDEQTSTKKKKDNQRRSTFNKFPHSDDDESLTDISIFAPIEGSESPQSPSYSRRNIDSPVCPQPGPQQEVNNKMEEERVDEDECVSDAESESLLAPVKRRSESEVLLHGDHSAQTSAPVEVNFKGERLRFLREDSDPGPSTAEPPERHQASTPDPPPAETPQTGLSTPGTDRNPHRLLTELACRSPPSSSSSSPHVSSSTPGLRLDAVSFWRNCNAAGCTQDIFNQFSQQINHIASRIQTERASQEDYDRALAVIEASGRLSDIMSQQEEEMKKKQLEFQKAAAMINGLKKK